jgi:nitrogen fixation NifU-like protein
MDDLYQEELLDIYKNPHNKGKISEPSISVAKKNPICGDDLTLQLKIDKDPSGNEKIREAKFDGNACMVSVVSASILTDLLVGKAVSEIKKLTEKDLLKNIKVELTASRKVCATLIFKALTEALETYEKSPKQK